MQAPDLARYARHSRWTEPANFAGLLQSLSTKPGNLPELVGGLVLHPLFAQNGRMNDEPQLRTVQEIVGAIRGKDARPLDQARELGTRVLGTCRSYAVLASGILREHGIPARLRVGFADYFTADFWEDHWVCEYNDDRVWRLLDAELTRDARRHLGIVFDPADVPRDRFLAAGPVWLALRHGGLDSARFGVSAIGISGLWFAASSLLRDLAALNGDEMMPWDYWGPARHFRPDAKIADDWLKRLDALADALAGLDAAREDAGSIVAGHPWAALEPSVLSFPQGRPVEVSIR